MPTKIKNSNIVDGTITSSKLALSGITAGEGGTCADTAPAGYVFNRKDFSSYGTPNGSCGAFTISGCHSISSGNWSPTLPAASYSIGANNTNWGDPCGNTAKRMYVQMSYGVF